MGSATRRRALFFAAHPNCCFCGGSTPAIEEDHFPSRAMFRDRVWPEGYVFPACANCNRATAQDELLVAMLGRSYPDLKDQKHQQEVVELYKGVHNNFPGLLEAMHLSANDKKKWLKEQEMEIPVGMTTADI